MKERIWNLKKHEEGYKDTKNEKKDEERTRNENNIEKES